MAYWKIIKKEEDGLHSIQAVWTSGHGESIVRRVNPISPIFFHNSSSVEPAIQMLKRSKKLTTLPVDVYLYVPMGVVKLFSASYAFALYFKMHWQGSDVANKIIFTNVGTMASELLESKCISNSNVPNYKSVQRLDPESIVRYMFSTAANSMDQRVKLSNSIRERLVFDEHKSLGDIKTQFDVTDYVEAVGGKDFIKSYKELSVMLVNKKRSDISHSSQLTQLIDKDSKYRIDGLNASEPKVDLFKNHSFKPKQIMTESEKKDLREGSLFDCDKRMSSSSSNDVAGLMVQRKVGSSDNACLVEAYCFNADKYLIKFTKSGVQSIVPMRTKKNTLKLFDMICNNWNLSSDDCFDEHSKRVAYLTLTPKSGIDKVSKILFECKKAEADLFLDEWEGSYFKFNIAVCMNKDELSEQAVDDDVLVALDSCSKQPRVMVNIADV